LGPVANVQPAGEKAKGKRLGGLSLKNRKTHRGVAARKPISVSLRGTFGEREAVAEKQEKKKKGKKKEGCNKV